MAILVDTGAWYALADVSDRHRADARKFCEELVGSEKLITDAILVETWALLTSRLGRQAARAFWGAFVRSASRTFAIMERLGITRAFALDTTFSSTGTVRAVNGPSRGCRDLWCEVPACSGRILWKETRSR